MTIRQIKYFIAIYEYRNMTKASESMYVSRPVLSRALIEFEKELDLSLFIRTTNGVEPTAQGHALYKTLTALFSTFDETLKRIRGEDISYQQRTFRLGILDAFGGWIYPKVLTPFKELHPEINICVEGIQSDNVMSYLIEGKLDCAIAPTYSRNPDLIDNMHLYNFEWCLCGPKDREFSKVTVQTLENLPMAILETLPPPFYTFDNKVLSTRQLEMLHMSISTGSAYAALPFELAADWNDVFCQPFSPQITTKIFLLWNKAALHNNTLQSFFDFIATVDF